MWLTELGSYPLRDLPRPERVVQLCHPALRNEFPPLRVRNTVVLHNLPAQLTSFVGRRSELAQLRRIATSNRLVTLTGTGGAGKTRLSVEVAAALNTEFADGVWFIGLAPITDPVAVTVTVARALDLPDQPGRSPWTPCGISSARRGSCCCSTTASTCWMRAGAWSSSCSKPARG